MLERKSDAEAFLRQEIAQSVDMECAASTGNVDVIAARVAVGEDVNKAGSFGVMFPDRHYNLQPRSFFRVWFALTIDAFFKN